MLAYPIELTPDDNGTLLVTCPDLPELTSFGEGEADALAHAQDALEEVLASRIAAGEPVPPPSAAGDRPLVALAAEIAAKVELYTAISNAGPEVTQVAARLGVAPAAVAALMDLNRAAPLAELDAAFATLGKRLEIVVRDAA